MEVEGLGFRSSGSIRARIFSYMFNVFFSINFVGVPSRSSPRWRILNKKKKKKSPLWLLDVTGHCVNVLLIIISFIFIFIYIVSLWCLHILISLKDSNKYEAKSFHYSRVQPLCECSVIYYQFYLYI